jgi:hypothetical protein
MTLTTDTLAELIQRRHDCLGELLSLTRQQSELAATGDLDGLLAVLDRKQPPLGALQRISRALRPFQKEDADSRTWAGSLPRAACQRLWAECEVMCHEIVELEQASENVLRERRDQISRRMDTGHWAQAIHAAYLQGTAPLAHGAGNQLDLTEE